MTRLRTHNFLLSDFEPFDLLWKNLFDHASDEFASVKNSKISYPVDIIETEDGLVIEIAIVGRDKDDIHIKIEEDVLNVSTTSKDQSIDTARNVICNGIKRSDIALSWKVSDKYDLAKTTAGYDKGLLKLEIPLSEEKKKLTKEIKIK